MGQPQLKMRHRNLQDLPPLQLPEGYSLRTLRGGESQRWADLLNSVQDLGEWNLERAEERLRGPIPPEQVFLITFHDEPIATACIVLHPGEQGTEAELGWVAVRPDHQGKRLGYHVCLAVLREIRKMGFNQVFLLTDDHRLPALKTYLNLGFEPDCWHETHLPRWAAVFVRLGVPLERLQKLI